jgi:ABC-2 type transport system permease protein
MRAALVRAVVAKDLLVVRRSRLVMLPMVLVPFLLLVVVPGGMLLAAHLSPPGAGSSDIAELLAHLPAALHERFRGYTELQMVVAYVAGYLWAPLFLVVPLVVSSGIAADSFAGERERKTLESLLYTPLTDLELFAGKVAGAWFTAMAVAAGGFVLYAVTVNLAGWPVMGRVFFPNLTWVLLLLWVAPAVALLGLGTVVILSARVETAHEAFQSGGLVVLPVVVLMIGQITGVLFFGPSLVVVLGAVVWVVALVVLRVGFRRFRRTELITRV